MCSGRQPAITPLAAMFKGVAARLAWGRTLMISSGRRSVKRRNAATRSCVGGMIARPSLHALAAKCWLIASKVPSNTALSGFAVASFSVPARFAAPVRPSTICANSDLWTVSLISSGAWIPMATGYSAIARLARPSAFAARRAASEKPLMVTATPGIRVHYRPHHGGRAGASAAVAGDHRIAALRLGQGDHLTIDFTLMCRCATDRGVGEGGIGHYSDILELFVQ